ncbi:hypothetical protein NC652_027092 [Populus alba x Populus x berolinensis]|nr:hypothetical protein NC652_027092 [Populus alba x Populus x berolinensis]
MGVFSNNNKKVKKKKQKQSSSVPVSIPNREFQLSDNDDFEEDYGGEDLVPPHIIVERRVPGKMAFSVCTGNGRTLKGRDLSEAVHIVPLQSNTGGSLSSSWFLRDPRDGVIDFQDLTFKEYRW